MKQIKRYEWKEIISLQEAKAIYLNKIANDIRIKDAIDEALLTIEEKYEAYYFYDAELLDHPYFLKVLDKEYNSTIDISCSFSDYDYILKDLSKDNIIEIEEKNYDLLEIEKETECRKMFLNNIKNKSLEMVLKKHNVFTKKYIIDISPIKEFDNINAAYYYERVYVFRYRSISSKKDFVSIISAANKQIYKFEFPFGEEYNLFLKSHKSLIEYIPKEYRDIYYEKAFSVYQNVKKMLGFETERQLYKRIKKSALYKDYSLHNEYIDIGIFYFKNKRFLNYLEINTNTTKEKIFYSYLTLKVNQESGLYLYECALLNILNKKENKCLVKFLLASYHLKSMLAKKKLYEYYTNPLTYNLAMAERYS